MESSPATSVPLSSLRSYAECFPTVQLSSAPEDDSRSASPPAEAVSLASSILAGKRIVIVEDEGVTQLQLRRSLTRMGMVVTGAANSGERGVALVLQQRPELVLMDISMPGAYDGLEAARRILAEYRVCIVLLTAFAQEDYQQRAREIGTSGYLLKPVVSDTLVSQLEHAYLRFSSH